MSSYCLEEYMQGISGDRVLIPTATACQQSGFSRGYIQRLVKRGRVEGIKLGHDWLIYEDSLAAFLAQPRERGRPKGQQQTSPEASVTRNASHHENASEEH
jgi:excisionase family DNA binding protein